MDAFPYRALLSRGPPLLQHLHVDVGDRPCLCSVCQKDQAELADVRVGRDFFVGHDFQLNQEIFDYLVVDRGAALGNFVQRHVRGANDARGGGRRARTP